MCFKKQMVENFIKTFTARRQVYEKYECIQRLTCQADATQNSLDNSKGSSFGELEQMISLRTKAL